MATEPYRPFLDEVRARCDDASDGELDAVCEAIRAARRVYIIGNGGSSAIASHIAGDLVKTCGVIASTFHDTALLTMQANDYGWENAYANLVETYAGDDDLVIGISSSGQSANIVNAVRTAWRDGAEAITLSGFKPDNPLRERGAVNLWCNSTNYNVVESCHLLWLLACVERLRG